MSARSHSKWNRTLTWMLSAALIVQGGAVVSASDFGSEVSAETTEEAPETVEMEEEAGGEPEFADDASGSIGETTDEGNNEPNVESREGDDAAEAEDVFTGAADFTSEIQMEEEDTLSDGLYLGDAIEDNSVGQIIDGNVVFHGISEDASLFVPVYGEKNGSKIAVRDMTWESSDESVVSIFDTDSEEQLQLRSHKTGGAVVTGTYQPADENGAADGEAMTVSFRVFVRGIVLDAGADSVQISLNEDISSQTIGYKLIDGTGETGEAAEPQEVTWSVEDPQIAEVDGNGNLTAKAPGETTVTLTWGEFTADSKVSVTGKGIRLIPASQSIQQTGATMIFAEAWEDTVKVDNPTLTWSSSDPSVATVDDRGIVSGIGTGKTDIVATWDGVSSEPLQITVTEATDVSVTTRWEDGGTLACRPAQVTLQLMSNGLEYDSIALGTDTEWRHVWVLLDVRDSSGMPITYDVSAEAPSGYTAEVQGNASEGFTVVYRRA